MPFFQGRAARNARRNLPPNFETEETKRAPHVLIFKRGLSSKVERTISDSLSSARCSLL